ncbi:MAG: DNA polymerase domain-containing protein [Nitrososphaera sp.]|uniref:DNA polymerase domain-containing protein n=1 Tax=Nitrososphaera sp. TaxID=1971748 RepID=UPI003D6ED8D0
MAQQEMPERRRRYDDLPELPQDIPALLLSAIYSGEEKKVYLKFYDPRSNVIYYWRDRTDHKPYAYTKIENELLVKEIVTREPKYSIQHVKKRDVIADQEIEVLKVLAPDPLSIGGTDSSLREKVRCWEADIKYHENYMYDEGLVPGIYYVRRGDKIEEQLYKISDKVDAELKNLLWDKIKEEGEGGKEYRQYVTTWANLLNQPIPELKRVALDIEVESEEGRMPTPRDHDRRVTAVGFSGSDGMRKVLVLGENMNDEGTPLVKEAEVCKSEKELIEKAFAIVNQYPIVLTYNGDDFDLPYLYARSQDPRISSDGKAVPKDAVPIVVKKESFIKRGMQAEPVGIRHGIHLDLFRMFQNRSIQIYAFSRKYTEFTLNAVSEALLEDSKLEFEGDIGELSMQKLAEYCMKDADLTFRLTSFNDNLLIKLLVVIARIGRMSVDDIARFGVNQWIRGVLYYEHRQRNELIPRTDELESKGKASTAAVIKEKKYRGGEVVEPTPGIHFNVVVLDFASLYPSIIKVHNLSYETINCVHPQCKETGKIEGTTHWVCQQRKGLSSLLIGSLRDLRVNYYKHLAKDKALPPQDRQLYNVVSQALKVILNASYGVMGAEIFPLYCLPVADATAAIGRNTINGTIDKCKELGIQVVYGDSVLPDTPVIIKRRDGNVDIVPIESLMPKTVSSSRYDKFGDLDVWTESGFTKIKYIYRHSVRKKGYRILTRKSFVECTEDHSLIINGKETKPSSLRVGDRIQLVPFKIGSHVNVNPDLAWLFGFFLAEGTCGSYRYEKPFVHVKNSWRIVNRDAEKLEKAKRIMQECLALPTTIVDIRESSASYGLVPRDNTKLLMDYFKAMCYRGTEKAIPQCILNANLVTKKAFIEGIMAGDGHMDVNGLVTIDQIHKTVQAGLVSLLEDLDLEYSLQIRGDKGNVCRIRVIKDSTDLRIKPADEIKKIEEVEIDGYVYDLETENHHFCGGIGNVLLHNTDSLFLKEPDQAAIDKVVAWARTKLGVDLEIDKQYRYVVFSDLKKNYLGVLPDGTVDVKGLTGKKSHTPPFIRTAFYEILGILGKVGSQKDFESAKESIKSIVQRDAKNLEAHKIPIDELSFNVMINKSISSYGKKVSSATTMDGKGAQVETYKGLPQHIKAAMLLKDKGREIKAGDIISYVKTKGGDGVKPVQLAKAEEIDTEKYLEAMESTFDQVLASLSFDFKSVLGKPRQQSLDELFWSKPSM